MRAIISIAFTMLFAASTFANKDRIEHTQALTVSFKTGDRATFVISNSAVTAITLHMGSEDFSVPAVECGKLRDLRFESVKLLWNGSQKSAADADYFYLQFEMGTEGAREYGELPRVQLMFRGGKFTKATVRKRTASNAYRDFEL